MPGVVGSSSTYTAPFLAMLMASFRRCRSPPERVLSRCPSVMYASPTSTIRASVVCAGPVAKNSAASAADIDMTSWMFLPFRRYSSTSSENPLPSHTSQTVLTVEANPSSVMMMPRPLHTGHAPAELALKRAGLTPFAFAKTVRIPSSTPVYVAGLLRREPRIGAWSTITTSSNEGGFRG